MNKTVKIKTKISSRQGVKSQNQQLHLKSANLRQATATLTLQEAQLMLPTGSTRLAFSRGQQR